MAPADRQNLAAQLGYSETIFVDVPSRDLAITQGNGSILHTWWSPDGWVTVGGRVVDDGTGRVDF